MEQEAFVDQALRGSAAAAVIEKKGSCHLPGLSILPPAAKGLTSFGKPIEMRSRISSCKALLHGAN